MAQSHKGMYQLISNIRESRDMAASINQNLVNIRHGNLAEKISQFSDTSNKLEFVKKIKGVDFINDSNSVNANGVWFALDSMTKKVTWITTINNLNTLIDDLDSDIRSKVKTVVLLSVYNSSITDYFVQLNKKVVHSMNLEEAVRSAFYASEPGEVILFSPGTPCSGLFQNPQERGEKFKEAVAQL